MDLVFSSLPSVPAACFVLGPICGGAACWFIGAAGVYPLLHGGVVFVRALSRDLGLWILVFRVGAVCLVFVVGLWSRSPDGFAQTHGSFVAGLHSHAGRILIFVLLRHTSCGERGGRVSGVTAAPPLRARGVARYCACRVWMPRVCQLCVLGHRFGVLDVTLRLACCFWRRCVVVVDARFCLCVRGLGIDDGCRSGLDGVLCMCAS